MKIDIVVKQDNKLIKIDSANNNFELKEEITDYGKRITGIFKPEREVEFVKAQLILSQSYDDNDKIMKNGYQSWTRSKEVGINHKEKRMSFLAKALDFHYHLSQYGDYYFYKTKCKEGVIHSHKYTYIKNNKDYTLYGALNEKECFTIFETDVNKGEIKVVADVGGLVVKSPIILFDFIITKGNRDYVFDTFFACMQIEKPNAKKIKGFTSWYNYYQEITEEIILTNLENFIKYKESGKDVDVFQIDDGYETFVGDWLDVDERKFPNGLKPIAHKINQSFISGLWLAPFVCEKKSKIYREHKDWILKDRKGRLVNAGINWSGFYALDIYNLEVREYLKNVFDTVFNKWGFKMVKLDFLYAACLGDRKDKSRSLIMREGMELLRELVGDNLLLGCGVPLSSAFGLVDYCRIGCDVSLDWAGGIIAKLAHNECVSTKDAIIDSISRFPLSGRAFLNDPDVFLLRSDNIKMKKSEKVALSVANAIFGKVLFTSDDFSKYDNKETLELLNAIWDLNDCQIIDYEIVDDSFYKAYIIHYGEKKTVYINVSDNAVFVDSYLISARSCKIA